MRITIQETRQHLISGPPPNGHASWQAFAASIPIYESVDMPGLTAGDNDPFFLTLDVMKVGETSLNGLVYDEAFVSLVEQQLAGKGAILGHTNEGDAAYPIEVADWVGHMRVDGRTWAKAYIPPGNEREFIRRILRRGGELRTSLQGMGIQVANADGSFRLTEFELDRLDFVPATQAALRRATSGRPIATRETQTQGKPMTEKTMTIADVPADVREAILREARLQADASRVSELEQQIATLTQARETAQARVSELEQQIAAQTSRITELEQAHSAAQARIADFERVAFERDIESTIAALTEGWNIRSEAGKAKLAALHKQVRRALMEALNGNRDAQAIRETATRLWADEFQGIAESLRDALAGPAAAVGAPTSSAQSLSDDALAQLAKRFIK